jgi:hypothetical protein
LFPDLPCLCYHRGVEGIYSFFMVVTEDPGKRQVPTRKEV